MAARGVMPPRRLSHRQQWRNPVNRYRRPGPPPGWRPVVLRRPWRRARSASWVEVSRIAGSEWSMPSWCTDSGVRDAPLPSAATTSSPARRGWMRSADRALIRHGPPVVVVTPRRFHSSTIDDNVAPSRTRRAASSMSSASAGTIWRRSWVWPKPRRPRASRCTRQTVRPAEPTAEARLLMVPITMWSTLPGIRVARRGDACLQATTCCQGCVRDCGGGRMAGRATSYLGSHAIKISK